MKSERSIQNEIRLEMANHGCVLWRNTVGTLKDRTGQYVTYGLCKGSADLIGFTIVDDEAIFTAVEVKRPKGKLTAVQAAFLALVSVSGGIACLATSAEDVLSEIRAFRKRR